MYLNTAPVTGGKIDPPIPQPMRNKGASKPVIWQKKNYVGNIFGPFF